MREDNGLSELEAKLMGEMDRLRIIVENLDHSLTTIADEVSAIEDREDKTIELINGLISIMNKKGGGK